jgi:MinD superfamily P-loop ATPase
MKIGIASGKGGTGKTTVSTSLAWLAAERGRSVAYLDCDVEEPNGHLFLKPEITETRMVGLPVPKVAEAKCTYCGECAKICRFSAIIRVGQTILVTPQMCHGCGGCTLVCPTCAITEEPFELGRLEKGASGSIGFAHGILNIGIAISPPLIKAVLEAGLGAELTIIDSPPGTSCPVIESVRDADYVVLVTEPTPFGLNDLKLAVEMVRALGLRFGVVINRSTMGDSEVQRWCGGDGIDILAEIAERREIAEAYSRGEIIAQAVPEAGAIFADLLDRIERKARA